MKKYLNKGLLYFWFNSAKVPIMLGLIFWGFLANSLLYSNLQNVKNNIAYSGTDYFRTLFAGEYFLLGFIFLAIYFMSGGGNKRNSTMFLTSGPYTKKQIRYNELIGLLITLILFVITYIYITVTFYVRNSQLLSIVNGYEKVIAIEVIRITLLGIIGISFMLIVDTLFTNSIIAILAMILLIPESIILIFTKLFSILDYFGIGNGESIGGKLDTLWYASKGHSYIPNALIEGIAINDITFKRLIFQIIITIVICIVILFVFNIAQRKYKLESGNKIFSSKFNENILVTLASIGAATFINVLTIQDGFIDNMTTITGGFMPLLGMDLIKVLTIDILSIGIISFISYKILKKILKTVC